jgi:hypothetical protein
VESTLNIILNPVVWLAVGVLVKNRLDKQKHRWGWFWWWLLAVSVVMVPIYNADALYGFSEETKGTISFLMCLPATSVAIYFTIKSLGKRRREKEAQAIAERNRSEWMQSEEEDRGSPECE